LYLTVNSSRKQRQTHIKHMPLADLASLLTSTIDFTPLLTHSTPRLSQNHTHTYFWISFIECYLRCMQQFVAMHSPPMAALVPAREAEAEPIHSSRNESQLFITVAITTFHHLNFRILAALLLVCCRSSGLESNSEGHLPDCHDDLSGASHPLGG